MHMVKSKSIYYNYTIIYSVFLNIQESPRICIYKNNVSLRLCI